MTHSPVPKPKVVLYNPQAVFFAMPLALLAVGSALDRTRYNVVVIDGRFEADPIARLIAEAADALCVGMTVLTGAPIRDALRASRALKAVRPELPVVWGGWHPSLFAPQCLDEPSIDVAVFGQGEHTFAEIVARLTARADLAGCDGAAFRDGGDVVVNPPRSLADTNALPPHDYGLVAVEQYFTRKRRRQLDYISSQGCRFRCTFCADPTVYGRGWVGLTPERMGEELHALWTRYRFDDITFQDETFFTHAGRVAGICEQLLTRGVAASWMATMRADQGCRMDDRLFALARRAGLRSVMVGVESGSQALLDWMKKDTKIAHVLDVADRCAFHGIGAIFNFIVGFPNETDDQLRETLSLVKRLRAMRANFETPIFYYRPYPGTGIGEYARELGYRFPSTLDEWADFDYVGRRGPWVSPAKWQLVERFKFYSRHAWGPSAALRAPLQAMSRWRCDRDLYAWPVEKALAEFVRPPQPVS
jgi:radical SAM superfamily enzyme YgiQ (UPF0313 family)